jgi:hypothetical protein
MLVLWLSGITANWYYGLLSYWFPGGLGRPNDRLGSYGDVAIRLKDALRQRATFSFDE